MSRLVQIALFILTMATPAVVTAQHQYTDSPLVCVRLGEMKTILKKVVQETQIAPFFGGRPSTDVLRGQGDCTYTNRPFTANRAEARRNGVRGAENLGGFVGWIVTDKWLVPVEQVAFLDRGKEKAWRPAAVLSRKRYQLRAICSRYTQTIHGVRIIGHQFDERGKTYCNRPLVVSN